MWFKNWDSKSVKHLIRCKLVRSTNSKLQKIDLYKSPLFGKILALDNQIQIGEKFNSYVHESLVHPAMLSLLKAKDILIIGGGDGFSLGEIIKYPYVKRIDVVEIDEGVINSSKEYFPEVKKFFNDKRVKIYLEDGFDYIKNTYNKYDVIILDISDPKDFALRIFSKEFLLKIKRIMKKRSVIATHCESPDSAGEIYYRIVQTYKSVFKIVCPYRVWIPHYIDFWGRLIASDSINPLNFSERDIDHKIVTLNIKLKWLNPSLFYSMFRSFSNDIVRSLDKKRRVIHEDENYTFSRL